MRVHAGANDFHYFLWPAMLVYMKGARRLQLPAYFHNSVAVLSLWLWPEIPKSSLVWSSYAGYIPFFLK